MAAKERIEKENQAEMGCPIVSSIAKLTADAFDICTEFDFENCEEILIFEMFRKLHHRGFDRDAIALLFIVFDLVENEQGMALLSVMGACNNDAAVTQFVNDFSKYCGRTALCDEKVARDSLN